MRTRNTERDDGLTIVVIWVIVIYYEVYYEASYYKSYNGHGKGYNEGYDMGYWVFSGIVTRVTSHRMCIVRGAWYHNNSASIVTRKGASR